MRNRWQTIFWCGMDFLLPEHIFFVTSWLHFPLCGLWFVHSLEGKIGPLKVVAKVSCCCCKKSKHKTTSTLRHHALQDEMMRGAICHTSSKRSCFEFCKLKCHVDIIQHISCLQAESWRGKDNFGLIAFVTSTNNLWKFYTKYHHFPTVD